MAAEQTSLGGSDMMFQFLGELDWTELNEQSPTPSAQTVRPKIKTKSKSSKPRKNPNLSWLHRKQELLSLRQDSKTLKAQQVELRQRQSRDPDKWKAAMEKKRLEKAQAVRVSLRERVRQHQHLGTALEKLMVRFEGYQQEEAFRKLVAMRALESELQSRQVLQLSTTSILNSLEKKVGARLQTFMNHVTDIANIDSTRDSNHIKVWSAPSEKHDIEIKDRRIMPFDVKDTFETFWKLFLGGLEGAGAGEAHVTQRSKDSIAVIAQYLLPIEKGQVVTINIHYIIKRQAAPGGFAAVLEAAVSLSSYLDGQGMWCFATEDSGSILIQQPAPEMIKSLTDNTAQACLCLSQMRIREDRHAIRNASHSNMVKGLHADLTRQLIIGTIRGFMTSQLQALDNAVLSA